MGSRAHPRVREAGRWERYYTQWGASGLALDLLPGPLPALRHARAQEPSSDWWHDPLWLEGCALIDVDRRVLSFEAPCADASYRAALLAVLAETWAGWGVEWAYDGPVGLAARTGADLREGLMGGSPLRPTGADGEFDPDTVFSVADEDSVRVGGLAVEPAEWLLCQGPALLDRDPDLLRPVESWKRRPRHGLHIDRERRTGGLWTSTHLTWVSADSLPGGLPRWPGWTWEFWGDDAGRHETCLTGRDPARTLGLPAPDPLAGLRRLSADFAEHQQVDGATQLIAMLLSVTETLRGGVAQAGGSTETVVDNATRHRPDDLAQAERTQVYAAMDRVERRLRGHR
ncbi:hypothetical protein [Streptomyces sp. NPDC056600]|uniref:hypothetical protein n=1 Tax=Streptomyces sp. NPDC056600 TaxID=3345874 RepID=UPI00367D7DD5